MEIKKMQPKILPEVENIILVASGKGGVGKSTVAVNLAVAFMREGYATGLLDADLYGPSVPMALGLENSHPRVWMENGKEQMEPVEKFGIKVMSLGFLMQKEDAVIWRGPLASKALTQLIENTHWGKLDYLVIDLPPGTGDISITLAQKFPGAKSIIVVTPQQMAIADGRKAAHMFVANGVDIPVIGIVENMAWFVPEKHPDEKYYLFGKGGGEQLAREYGVPLLSQIPLMADVCELSDQGKNFFNSGNAILIKAFEELAQKIDQEKEVPA
jgi:ATP-binding protein involved in chromosome partitioning